MKERERRRLKEGERRRAKDRERKRSAMVGLLLVGEEVGGGGVGWWSARQRAREEGVVAGGRGCLLWKLGCGGLRVWVVIVEEEKKLEGW